MSADFDVPTLLAELEQLRDRQRDVPVFHCQTHLCGQCSGCKRAGVLDENSRLRGEVEQLRTDLAREERDHGRTIDERDRIEGIADQLAYTIAPMEVIGEHSSGNNPWQNALDIATEGEMRA